jgi:hypothetical protein
VLCFAILQFTDTDFSSTSISVSASHTITTRPTFFFGGGGDAPMFSELAARSPLGQWLFCMWDNEAF